MVRRANGFCPPSYPCIKPKNRTTTSEEPDEV
jgi:hypothetical protein